MKAVPTPAAERIAKAQARARAKKDPAEHVAGAPEGYRLRGVSTLVDAEGRQLMQWVKTSKEEEQCNALLEAFHEAVLAKPIPVKPRTPAPTAKLNRELLAVYPMGDPHFGMLAWPAETGNDFNLKIARRHLTQAVHHLVNLMPAARTALLINLGDMLHADGPNAMTTKGTRVDVDSRWGKMLTVAIETLTVCIDALLRKHHYVHVDNAKGNHDDQSSTVLSLCLAAHYRNEPRVKVNTSPAMFLWHEFGECLLGVTHGHTAKAKDLPGVMATDQSAAWGRTKHRMFYTGHVHHETVKEFPGCVVESFRTLAAKDAWHHGQGYRARRGMVADVWHLTRGKILRHEIGVESL